jgi:hypothetical protein
MELGLQPEATEQMIIDIVASEMAEAARSQPVNLVTAQEVTNLLLTGFRLAREDNH